MHTLQAIADTEKKLIPVCLVVGFLGSGKTTLLRHIIKTHSEKRLAFVVNEFSPVDVDGTIIQKDHDKVVCLAGGSVFCKCLSGQFIQTLKDLPQALHLPRCDGVVVEASGIADPGVAGQMLHESGLDSLYRLSQVVAVVDPGNIERLLERLPNTRSQLIAADSIIINKNDVYSLGEMDAAERAVSGINRRARIIRSSHCDADIHFFESRSRVLPSGNYALCADPNFCTATVVPPAVIDVDRLITALHAWREDLYRAKGFLSGRSGPVYLDWTPTTISRFELPDYDGGFAFVLIGAGEKASTIKTIAARMESGAFSADRPGQSAGSPK